MYRFRLALCALLICVGVIAAGCGDARNGPGVIIASDGRFLANSPENHRAHVIATITASVDAEIGAHWRSTTTIVELPEWADRSVDDGAWWWTTATVTVDLVGDGAAPLGTPAERVRISVAEYLARKVRRRADLRVEVRETIDPARFAVLAGGAASTDPVASTAPITSAAPAASTAALTPAGPRAPRTYTVQPGDTLADISIAFYGTAQHWRAIAQANPGIDPAQLAPGAVIAIPTSPAP